MSYRKQISYLELQENGKRIRGAGYAKLESWEEEEILMNGVMDLVIQTPEGAIILDFKSDRVNPGEEEVHAARYAPQLDIYARAYEKVWQQLVLKKVIYFLSSGGVSPQV